MHTSVTDLTKSHPRHSGYSYPEANRRVNTPLRAMNMPPFYEDEEQKGDCRLVLLVRLAELLQENQARYFLITVTA